MPMFEIGDRVRIMPLQLLDGGRLGTVRARQLTGVFVEVILDGDEHYKCLYPMSLSRVSPLEELAKCST